MSTKERPILFSAPMVRAILDGRKTQTRRVVAMSNSTVLGDPVYLKEWPRLDFSRATATDVSIYSTPESPDMHLSVPVLSESGAVMSPDEECRYRVRPRYEVGDHLWVRETHWRFGKWVRNGTSAGGRQKWRFRVDRLHADKACFEPPHKKPLRTNPGWHKRPSIFMPRWASRITLEIVSVRVERVQDIGKDGRYAKDVLAEGITDVQIEHWRKWLHQDDAPAHTYGILWNAINGKGSWASNPWIWVISFKRVDTDPKS